MARVCPASLARTLQYYKGEATRYTPCMPRTFKVFGVLDVNFLVQLKRFLVVPHPAEAARDHQAPLHLGEQIG